MKINLLRRALQASLAGVLCIFGIVLLASPAFATVVNGGNWTVSQDIVPVLNTSQGGAYTAYGVSAPISGSLNGNGYEASSAPSAHRYTPPAAPKTTGYVAGACRISANPNVAAASGDPVILTLTSISPTIDILFQGKRYSTGSTVVVQPLSTTVYSATTVGTPTVSTCSVPIIVGGGAMSVKNKKTELCLMYRIDPGVKHSREVVQIQRFLKAQGYNVVINGVYGNGTKKALASFQTKYANDILKPQGIQHATGIWATATAKKANTLGLCNS